MTAWTRALLIVEAILCFGPITYLRFASFAAIPFSLIAFFSGKGVENLLFPLLTVLGGVGLLGSATLFSAIGQESIAVSPRKLVFQLTCGVVACIALIVFFGAHSSEAALWFLGPLLGTLHFSYLCRRSLFPANRTAN